MTEEGDNAAAVSGSDSGSVTTILNLYVAGMTPKSTVAIATVRDICKNHLPGRCQLEVIDIYEQPDRAREAHVIAAPTLIKILPLPLRRLVGDLSDTARILTGLELFTT